MTYCKWGWMKWIKAAIRNRQQGWFLKLLYQKRLNIRKQNIRINRMKPITNYFIVEMKRRRNKETVSFWRLYVDWFWIHGCSCHWEIRPTKQYYASSLRLECVIEYLFHRKGIFRTNRKTVHIFMIYHYLGHCVITSSMGDVQMVYCE